MSIFEVNLNKFVDDSYQVEIGFGLINKLLEDLKAGLIGNIRRFAVVTDSNVRSMYGENLNSELRKNGYESQIIVFEAGEKIKLEKQKKR